MPAAAVALVLATGTLARAQDAAVELLAPEVGWDGVYSQGDLVPLRVTVRSTGTFSGRVVVEGLPGDRIARYAAPVSLASRGERVEARVLLLVPARGDGSFAVSLEDEAGRRIGEAKDRRVVSIDPSERIVLAVRSSGLGALDAPADPTARGGPRLHRLRVARVSTDALPGHARGFSGVAGVVLADAPGVAALARDREKVAALAELARAGGTLCVAGGSGAAFWRGTPLEELLPVDAAGERAEAPARSLAALAPRGPVTAERATVREGVARARLLLGDAATPLAVERPLGLGRVVFLAFDPDQPALRGSVKLAPFLASLFPSAPSVPRIRAENLARDSERAFAERRALSPTALAAISFALALHLVAVGPVTGLVRRRLGALAALASVPLASLSLALFVLALAATLRGAPAVRTISWAFSESGGDAAWVVEDVGLFSGRGATFELALAPGAIPLRCERPKLDLLRFRDPGPELLERPGVGPRVSLSVLPREHAWLRSGGVATLPPSARARAVAARGSMTLRATAPGASPLPASLALLLDPRGTTRALEVAPLAAGATVSLDLAHAPLLHDLVTNEEDGVPRDLWEGPAGTRRLLVRAGALVEEERAAQVQATPGSPAGAPPPRAIFLIVPACVASLSQASAGGAPVVDARSIGALVVAAEEEAP